MGGERTSETTTVVGSAGDTATQETLASETQCQHAEAAKERERDGDIEQHYETKAVSPWRLRILVAIVYFWCWSNGYDTSNVANIQPQIYNEFHQIEFLPWIGLSYCTAVFAGLVLARQLAYTFDFRCLVVLGQLGFVVGSAVSGGATDMAMLIVGRMITGIGGAVLYFSSFTYVALIASPDQGAQLISGIGVFWSLGVIVGGPIGSGFAQNHHTTWRWALYLVSVLMGFSLVLSLPTMPSYTTPSDEATIVGRLKKSDFLGVALCMASVGLFGVAVTFSGPVWRWGSGAVIATWVVFAVVLIATVLQQTLCFLTTPERRAIPYSMIFSRRMGPIWVACGCSGTVYGMLMYYTPLFFAFMRGMGPVQQSIRLFPFIFVGIVTIAFTGRMLPVVQRYKYVYILAGTVSLAGAASLAATLKTTTSNGQVMGLTAFVGFGFGLQFLHGNSITNAMHSRERDRVVSSIVGTMSMFGGLSVSLMMAGSIYQNVGYRRLSHVFEGQNVTRSDIQAALSGVASFQMLLDPELEQRTLEAMCATIGDVYYLAAAAGAICVICGLLMMDERDLFNVPTEKKKKKEPKEEERQQTEETMSSPGP